MPDYPVRKNLRLKTWDYTSGGTYFITICTKDRRHTLSAIVGGDAYIAPQVRLTPLGQLAERHLSSIPGMIKFVVMPNHVHFGDQSLGYAGLAAGLSRPHHPQYR